MPSNLCRMAWTSRLRRDFQRLSKAGVTEESLIVMVER